MKKIMASVLLSVVLMGTAVLNVWAITDACSHNYGVTETVDPRSSSYSHAVESVSLDGSITLVGCTVTTVQNVRVTTCNACKEVIDEEVFATYGPYHSINHD